MTIVYKALGALLAYPTADLIAALPEIGAIIRADAALSAARKAELAALLDVLATGDLIDLQERYVELFDRGRRTSLHLFEHVHGDSRARGQAMVDLKAVYAEEGFELAAHELPDYLPAVLEFATLAPRRAAEILHDCAHIVRALGATLRARGSAYHGVAAAVLDVVGVAGLDRTDPAPAAEETPLDQEWQEEQVFFGPPGGQGCGAHVASAPAVSVVQFVRPVTAA